MPRLPMALVTIALALSIGLDAYHVVAQEATPAPAGEAFPLPPGVTSQPLGSDTVATLPATPARIEMLRVTFAPGSALRLPAESPSLALVYVEAGTLTARIEAPVAITRAASPGAAPDREEIPAGTEFSAGPGDSFIGPAHTPVEVRNDGQEPLTLLMAVVQPAPSP